MAHALTPDLGHGHFDAALLADDSLVFHALVLAAQALIVLDRAEDSRAEQAVAFGLERAVVDRLRLFDLAIRPRQDAIRRRDRNLDAIESRSDVGRAENVEDFLVHGVPNSSRAAMPQTNLISCSLSLQGGGLGRGS